MEKTTRIIFEGGDVVGERHELDRAYEKAIEALSRDAIDPHEKKFVETYGKTEIQKDDAYIREREGSFKKEGTIHQHGAERISKIFEGLVHEQAELNDWLGPDAHTVKTSRYDDIKNGVDLVVEFQRMAEEVSRLALAIDITFGPAAGEDKIERIAERIQKNSLAKIKYLDPEGTRDDIPLVVIGISRESIRELVPFWLKRDNKKLSEHLAQFMILEEMRMQLQMFEAYARFANKGWIAEKYKTALQIILEVIKSKEDLRKRLGISDAVLRKDPVFAAIADEVAMFWKSFASG